MEAGENYPAYNRLVEELGKDGNVTAMEALAEILAYIDPDKGIKPAGTVQTNTWKKKEIQRTSKTGATKADNVGEQHTNISANRENAETDAAQNLEDM